MMDYSYGNLNFIQLIIILILSSLMLSFIGKKYNYSIKKMIVNKSYFSLLVFINIIFLLIYVCAFRTIGHNYSNIGGYDAGQYKDYFLDILKSNHYEPGFKLLIWTVKLFTNNYSIFLIIVSSLMLYCMFKFLKETNNSNIFLVFMLLILYFESFNTLRTNIAIFIFLLVILKLNENNYKRAILYTIIAISIHISATIIIPVIFINYLFKEKKKLPFVNMFFLNLFLCILAFVFAYFIRPYVSNTDYEVYVDIGLTSINVFLFAAFIFLLSSIKYYKLVESNVINRTLIITVPIIFLVLPMELIYQILYRMCLYFLPIIYTLMAQVFKIDKSIILRTIIISLYLYKINDFLSTTYYIGIV